MNVLRVGMPLRVAGHLLVPVARVWLHTGTEGDGWAVGGYTPVAVVIRDATGTRAVNVDGGDADLDALLREVTGLAAALEAPGPP